MAPSLHYPGSYIGDLYDNRLSRSDIADRLRESMKGIVTRPNRFSISCGRRSCSIGITIKGPGLLDDRWNKTETAQALKEAVTREANRYNYDENDPGSDGQDCGFYLHVHIDNLYPRAEIEAEAARLQSEYAITDHATLCETGRGCPDTPLTQQALELLGRKFATKKPRPGTSLRVAEEMERWLARVAEWYKPCQYETGPRYFRVVDGNETVCLVDRKDGTIHKAAYRAPAPNSTRGTIFDAHEVFDKRGLIRKPSYTSLLLRMRQQEVPNDDLVPTDSFDDEFMKLLENGDSE